MAGNRFSGRKSKQEEQTILEQLSMLDELFFIKLREAIEQGKPYAMKIFSDARIPKQKIEVNHSEEQPLFDISYSINEINK